MNITLSQFAGFCDGVKRAYGMVSSLNMDNAKKPVRILGSLVHNPAVIEKIEQKGISKIDRDEFFNARPGEIGTVIITAHGVGPGVFETAKKNNMEVIDTTCPKVIKVQRLAQVYNKRGYRIVLVGDKGHKEVKGINEWGGGKAYVVSQEKDLENLKFEKGDKIAVLTQTTQSEDLFIYAADFIRKKFPNVETVSTICNATHERQEEAKKLARENEVMIVIGSKESANSTRLFEISRSINSESYFIENASEFDSNWLSGIEKVAVTAGASTPDWIIEKVLSKLLQTQKPC